jgi:hypothetical protein
LKPGGAFKRCGSAGFDNVYGVPTAASVSAPPATYPYSFTVQRWYSTTGVHVPGVKGSGASPGTHVSHTPSRKEVSVVDTIHYVSEGMGHNL